MIKDIKQRQLTCDLESFFLTSRVGSHSQFPKVARLDSPEIASKV